MAQVVYSARRGVLLRARPNRKSDEAKRRRRRVKPTKTQRQAILERDGFKCVRCGSTDDLTVDHIIPAAKGGTKQPDNLETLCSVCNEFKGDSLGGKRIRVG
jgi:5-methylcytosine-specific restriction endonuclease McrA